jgi:hypothetical protein
MRPGFTRAPHAFRRVFCRLNFGRVPNLSIFLGEDSCDSPVLAGRNGDASNYLADIVNTHTSLTSLSAPHIERWAMRGADSEVTNDKFPQRQTHFFDETEST